MPTIPMKVECTCPFCGRHNIVIVDMIQYGDWLDGMKIQDAMPDTSASEREMLMTGMCLECQAETFGE